MAGCRQQRHRLHGQSRRTARRDRPERRRQDHLLQDADLRNARRPSGKILFQGRDITGKSVTDVCQLGLTKSYQVNQLFTRLTVRENIDDRGARRFARHVLAGSVPDDRTLPGLADRSNRPCN